MPDARASEVSVEPVHGPAGRAAAFPRLSASGPGSVLLETGGPPGTQLLVWDPAATFALVDGTPTIRADPNVDLPRRPRTAAEMIPFLDRVVRSYSVPRSGREGRLPAFVGGLVGFLSYEWAAAQEGPRSAALAGFPELWFGLYDRALVRCPGSPVELVVNPALRGADPRRVRQSLGRPRRSAAPARQLAPAPGGGRPDVEASWSREGFENAVREVRHRIRRGDLYQVNLALQLRSPRVDPWQLYRALSVRNPSPFAGYLQGDGFTLVSGSPERVLRTGVDTPGGRTVETRPIAGTRPRGRGADDGRNERSLRRSPKERAEHTMLVDLARNDLGRVALPGSVEVDEWLSVERYSHVMHLVSNVRGRLGPGVGLPELFRALLPGGSVTGTPKIRATEVIAELEPVPRGPYTGSMGYVGLDGRMDLNLLIRSAFFGPGRSPALTYAGAGIVEDSRPDREWAEVQRKAAVLLEALQGRRSRGRAWAPPRRSASWCPPFPPHQHPGARVLLIDNYDSFTYNLAQYLTALGARVDVVRNDAESTSALRARRPTHLVLSPGPGRPSEAGVTCAAVRAFEGTPILGVCLGHEAIVEVYGGHLGIAPRRMHGKTSRIRVTPLGRGRGPMRGLPETFEAARYHSLVAREVPSVLEVTARSDAGEIMAVQHAKWPTYGVQFHPESLRTPQGMRLLDGFLAGEAADG